MSYFWHPLQEESLANLYLQNYAVEVEYASKEIKILHLEWQIS